MNLSVYMSRTTTHSVFCRDQSMGVVRIMDHPTILYIGMVAAKMFSVFDI